MPNQSDTLVRVAHPDTGHAYAVTEHDYKSRKMARFGGQTYEEAGYKIVSYEDGTAYGGDEKPSDRALHASAMMPVIGVTREGTNALTNEPAVNEDSPEPAPASGGGRRRRASGDADADDDSAPAKDNE